jgi:hypothetical protein
MMLKHTHRSSRTSIILSRFHYAPQIANITTTTTAIKDETATGPTYYVKQEKLGNVSQFVYDQRRLRAGTKSSLTKYYAVRRGREIGIFIGWENTKGKVLEFPRALYKIFLSRKKAENWLAMENVPKEEDLPAPKAKAMETVRKAKYVLNFDISISRVEDLDKKGQVGLGWMVRKYPERELICAGSELFELPALTTNKKGFRPVLNPELPALQALNNGLDEMIRVLKLNETSSISDDNKPSSESPPVAPEKKVLDLPLIIRSNRAYPIGMLLGVNPTLNQLADQVKEIKSKIAAVSGEKHTIEHVDLESNVYSTALAKAALSRIGKGEKKLVIEDKTATTGGYQSFLERFLGAPVQLKTETQSKA